MKTIVWDVDDVLNGLMFEWFHFNKERINPRHRIKYEHIRQNPPHQIFNLSQSDYFTSLDHFRNSEQGKNLKPNPIILKWLYKDGENFRHIALTARPLNTVPVLTEWLFRYFGNWIRMFAFVPAYRDWQNAVIYDRHKADFLNWLNKADFFIDDSPENVTSANELGIRTFLYPQPWNDGGRSIEEILTEISNSVH